ncbi:uncharacterized protein A4U43_C08F17040 [Asparagus officinalis]|nr:uncharacterized protein A4U43_C08F17040 [Asparagus officinalis]
MSDHLREMGNKDYEKVGRHGSDLFTKVPPKAVVDGQGRSRIYGLEGGIVELGGAVGESLAVKQVVKEGQ